MSRGLGAEGCEHGAAVEACHFPTTIGRHTLSVEVASDGLEEPPSARSAAIRRGTSWESSTGRPTQTPQFVVACMASRVGDRAALALCGDQLLSAAGSDGRS